MKKFTYPRYFSVPSMDNIYVMLGKSITDYRSKLGKECSFVKDPSKIKKERVRKNLESGHWVEISEAEMALIL